jgi:hypothetical protein
MGHAFATVNLEHYTDIRHNVWREAAEALDWRLEDA